MERRKFLIGAGSAAIGSSALIGSGAFSTASADRSVSVTVTGDENAYLALDATDSGPNAVYADEQGDDGQLSIDFGNISESTRDANVTSGGQGVNPDASLVAHDVFRVRNQGTQGVEVNLSGGQNISINSTTMEDDDEVYFYFDSGNENYDDDSTAMLETGDEIHVDVAIETDDSDTSFDTLGDLTVSANADDFNSSQS